MLEIKDIVGLSDPLKRLVEVVAEGIGGVSRPFLLRKNADAKAYEIKTIAEAIADSQKLLGAVKYDRGEIVIESNQGKGALELPEATFDSRVVSRMAYQEAKRQSNLERITQIAADDFDGTEEIGSDRPDSDWTTRFFRIAEDITTDEMQALWGKVLAGEVKRPGSFSLRTLEMLKNISQKEAEIFTRVARIAFTSGDKVFVPNIDKGKFLNDHFGIDFSDLLLLQEIGLLLSNDIGLSLSAIEEDDQFTFTCGSTCVIVDRPAGTPMQTAHAEGFTEIGRQLFQLVEREPADPLYIEKFASSFQSPGVVVRSGIIVDWKGDEISCDDLSEVPGNKPKPIEAEKSNQ